MPDWRVAFTTSWVEQMASAIAQAEAGQGGSLAPARRLMSRHRHEGCAATCKVR